MIDKETQQEIQAHRLQQIRRRLREHDYAGVVLFDPINIRYATGSRNMQVWTMHNFCRYAVILEAGGVILFDLPGSMHLSQGLSQITELRPAVSTDYMIVGGRSDEMADRWAAELKSVLRESGIQRENIAIDRADLALCLACQKADIHLKDGKSVMEKARAIKSIAEIRALKWSLGTCEESVRDLKDRLEPGMRESEALALLIKGCVERGAEYPETRLLTSGPRTIPWFQETSDRIINNGDMIAFDTDMIGHWVFITISPEAGLWVTENQHINKGRHTKSRMHNYSTIQLCSLPVWDFWNTRTKPTSSLRTVFPIDMRMSLTAAAWA